MHAYDVIIVGGGPGGAAAATALARRGRRVLVLEREAFPRFHIGESQLPWSRELWRELGLDEALGRAGFVDKWGATFITANGAVEQYADFTAATETPQPQTYQVPRADFDRIVLAHAAASGADVRQPAQAVDLTFEHDGVTVRFLADGTQLETRAAAIVDASGRAGFVARRRSERQFDPQLRNVSLHAQYEDVPRPTGRRAGDIRMVMRPDRGWFWFIPLSATVTSIGIVLPKEAHARSAGATLEQALADYLAETPTAAALTAHARRVTPVRFDADYSYCARRFAGDRWLLVGDAGAFLDPIFSTGVFMAMQSGVDAAEALDAALTAGDLSARRFARYERATRARWAHFRRFAVGFYDPAFRDLFFRPRGPFRMREAVISILAGNWRPGLATRLRIALFFAFVAVQRRIAIAPRLGDLDAAAAPPSVRPASHAA